MKRVSFNDDWHIITVDSGQDGPSIGPVSVPIDMMMLAGKRTADCPSHSQSGYYHGGVYIYRKTFLAPSSWQDQTVIVEFEAIYHRSNISLNGKAIGGRANGYLPIHIDLTKQNLKYGQDNVLEVHVDTAKESSSRWYSGSGIYRPVYLLSGPRRAYIGPNDCKIHTTSIRADGSAVLEMSIQVTGRESIKDFNVTLVDSAGYYADLTRQPVPNKLELHREHITVQAARLWSPEDPHLYTVQVRAKSGSSLDIFTDTIGICMRSLTPKRGFELNGKTYKLRGGCIHHDSGIIGATTLDMVEDRRIRILKENGYNAIRSSHNALSKASLRACDKYGLFVMDELTDLWRTSKETPWGYQLDFDDWWERDLTTLVERDYNHPSVAFISIGNEIMETAGTWGIEQGAKMVATVRKLDSTRFVTNSINGFLNAITPVSSGSKKPAPPTSVTPKSAGTIMFMNLAMSVIGPAMNFVGTWNVVDRKTRDSFALLDLAGYNYLSGRYEMDVAQYPERIIVGSETGTANLWQMWPTVEKHPQLIGDFSWTAWDYIGEAGIAAVTYRRRQAAGPFPALLAGTSIIDILGFPQTQAWWNQTIWGLTKKPILAVKPLDHAHEKFRSCLWRSTDSIASWSFDGYEGVQATVEIYSASPTVDLLLDGKPIGRVKTGPQNKWMASIRVPYTPGTLTAVAFDENGRETGRSSLISAGPEIRIRALPEAYEMTANGQDAIAIPVEIVDRAGTLHVLKDRKVSVRVQGASATVIGFGSAKPVTTARFTDTEVETYYGRVMAVLRATLDPGDATVTFTADGCGSETVRIVVHPKSSEK